MDFTCPVGTVTRSEQCQCLSATFSLPVRHLFHCFSLPFHQRKPVLPVPRARVQPCRRRLLLAVPTRPDEQCLDIGLSVQARLLRHDQPAEVFRIGFHAPRSLHLRLLPLAKFELELCVEKAAGPVLLLKAGWYRLTQPDGTYSIFLCRNGDACPEQEAGTGYTTNCSEGHIAPLCASCHEDFALDGEGGCTRCNETTVQVSSRRCTCAAAIPMSV